MLWELISHIQAVILQPSKGSGLDRKYLGLQPTGSPNDATASDSTSTSLSVALYEPTTCLVQTQHSYQYSTPIHSLLAICAKFIEHYNTLNPLHSICTAHPRSKPSSVWEGHVYGCIFLLSSQTAWTPDRPGFRPELWFLQCFCHAGPCRRGPGVYL